MALQNRIGRILLIGSVMTIVWCIADRPAPAVEVPQENAKVTAPTATGSPAPAPEIGEQAKRIADVMQSVIQDEADAIGAGKEDPNKSLQAWKPSKRDWEESMPTAVPTTSKSSSYGASMVWTR